MDGALTALQPPLDRFQLDDGDWESALPFSSSLRQPPPMWNQAFLNTTLRRRITPGQLNLALQSSHSAPSPTAPQTSTLTPTSPKPSHSSKHIRPHQNPHLLPPINMPTDPTSTTHRAALPPPHLASDIPLQTRPTRPQPMRLAAGPQHAGRREGAHHPRPVAGEGAGHLGPAGFGVGRAGRDVGDEGVACVAFASGV
ncbi:hypothetical protein N658DRAFT_306489 [Parathielavia hyrcaniae]|uniref:Uncharacterized protein n=1 Tax=Parathielavia hyrcaniae TaxID=113614 RepID=A0AAN6T3A8_9PEZI|nr:hypothetical protein N658DRAFT_306489 [Parathielavia hyrcaniae]